MPEPRESARQLATCHAILLRAHSRVRVYLWRRWEFGEQEADTQLLAWTLSTLWSAMLQFPNQAMLATYLKHEGRQFCRDALSEARTALRFLKVLAGVIVGLVGLALALALLGLLPTLTLALWISVVVILPLWLLFLRLEAIEYRTARALAVAIETAIERLE